MNHVEVVPCASVVLEEVEPDRESENHWSIVATDCQGEVSILREGRIIETGERNDKYVLTARQIRDGNRVLVKNTETNRMSMYVVSGNRLHREESPIGRWDFSELDGSIRCFATDSPASSPERDRYYTIARNDWGYFQAQHANWNIFMHFSAVMQTAALYLGDWEVDKELLASLFSAPESDVERARKYLRVYYAIIRQGEWVHKLQEDNTQLEEIGGEFVGLFGSNARNPLAQLRRSKETTISCPATLVVGELYRIYDKLQAIFPNLRFKLPRNPLHRPRA